MCNRSYHIASGAPPEQSDLCLLCGAAADTAGHMFGGCEKLEAFYTSRHTGAGLLTLKALAQGSQGGCFWLSDVTSVEDKPEFSSGTRLPEWILPGVQEPTRLRLRPDAVRIATLAHNAQAPRTRAQRSPHVVDLLEFGYCSDTRMAGKMIEKQGQHDLLQKLLLEAGWKDVKLRIFPLGTLGAIHSSSLPNLVAFGLAQATATKLLTKLSRHAVNAARAIVRKKRELEQELWSAHERREGRQGVG